MNLLLVKITITLKWNMLSTCFLNKDLQFGTLFEQIECCMVIYRQRSLFLSIK